MIPKEKGSNFIIELCHRLNIELFTEFTVVNHNNLITLNSLEHYKKPILKLQSAPGQASPRTLSKWRINALKLMIKYKEQGYIISTDAHELGVPRALEWFKPLYRDPKIGRCYRMVLRENLSPKSPAEGYEAEMLELRKLISSQVPPNTPASPDQE